MKRLVVILSIVTLIPLGYVVRTFVYPNVVLQRYLQLLADHPGHAYTTTVATRGSYPVEFYIEEPAKGSAGAPVRFVVNTIGPKTVNAKVDLWGDFGVLELDFASVATLDEAASVTFANFLYDVRKARTAFVPSGKTLLWDRGTTIDITSEKLIAQKELTPEELQEVFSGIGLVGFISSDALGRVLYISDTIEAKLVFAYHKPSGHGTLGFLARMNNIAGEEVQYFFTVGFDPVNHSRFASSRPHLKEWPFGAIQAATGITGYVNPSNSVKSVVQHISSVNNNWTDLLFDGKIEGYDYDKASVRVFNNTRVYLNGKRVERDAIRTGDVVEVYYYGQHDSLPPILLASAVNISRPVSP